jgi:hypothetical protein
VVRHTNQILWKVMHFYIQTERSEPAEVLLALGFLFERRGEVYMQYLYDTSSELSVTVAEILKSGGFFTVGVKITPDGDFETPCPRLASDIAIISGASVIKGGPPCRKRSWSGRHVTLTIRSLDPKSIPVWTRGIQPFAVRDTHCTGKWRITFEYAVLQNAIDLCRRLRCEVPSPALQRVEVLKNQIEAVIAYRKDLRHSQDPTVRPYSSF